MQSCTHNHILFVFLLVKGLRGFYRPYLTTILREIPFGSIQFPLWESLKDLVLKISKKDHCEPYQSAMCGAIAGDSSFEITYKDTEIFLKQ